MNMNFFRFFVFVFVLIFGLLSSVFAVQKGEFTLKIVDEETNRPLPCRVTIRNEKGVVRKAAEVPFLYDHFVMPGEVFLDWPLGTYPLTIERGFEYLPRTGHFVLNTFAKDSKTETLKRFVNLSEKGWWSGDLMVMRDLHDAELLMLADDLHFVPFAESSDLRFLAGAKKKLAENRALLREQSGRTEREQKAKSDEVWFDSDRFFTTQNYILRHPAASVGILNLPTAVHFEKLKIEDRPSALPMLYAIRKKYPTTWLDLQDADCWDLPALVALGLVDSFQILGPHILRDQMLPENMDWKKIPEVKSFQKLNAPRLLLKPDENADEARRNLQADLFLRPSQCSFTEDSQAMNYRDVRGQQQWREEVWFHLLNTGHKIPPSAGSGSGMAPNAVGSNRMYVFVDPETIEKKAGYDFEGANAGFTQKAWWDALRSGRCVVTNGPLLQPWVEGSAPGEVFKFQPGEPEKLNPSMTLHMQKKAQYIEFIVNGRIAQSVPFRNYAETGRLPLLEIKESGWFLIRIIADEPQRYEAVLSAPYYVEMGDEKPEAAQESAEFFVAWQKTRMKMLKKRGDFDGPEGERLCELHEFALAYWEKLAK